MSSASRSGSSRRSDLPPTTMCICSVASSSSSDLPPPPVTDVQSLERALDGLDHVIDVDRARHCDHRVAGAVVVAEEAADVVAAHGADRRSLTGGLATEGMTVEDLFREHAVNDVFRA